MGTQRVQVKGVLPWLVHRALHTGTRDFCPAQAQGGPFFPHRTLFRFICPHRLQQAGQAVVQGRLSLNVCLW
jgi:hypothetical protein